MQKLNVGDKVYWQNHTTLAVGRQTVDRLTLNYAVLDNGDRVHNRRPGVHFWATIKSHHALYYAESADLLKRYERTQLLNKANHAVNTAKHTNMTDEELKTIIELYNKY